MKTEKRLFEIEELATIVLKVGNNIADQSFLDTVQAAIVNALTRILGNVATRTFADGDVLLLGRESVGVPDAVHGVADMRLRVPLAEGTRSLNVALAGAMVLGEALRQTDGFPGVRTNTV